MQFFRSINRSRDPPPLLRADVKILDFSPECRFAQIVCVCYRAGVYYCFELECNILSVFFRKELIRNAFGFRFFSVSLSLSLSLSVCVCVCVLRIISSFFHLSSWAQWWTLFITLLSLLEEGGIWLFPRTVSTVSSIKRFTPRRGKSLLRIHSAGGSSRGCVQDFDSLCRCVITHTCTHAHKYTH